MTKSPTARAGIAVTFLLLVATGCAAQSSAHGGSTPASTAPAASSTGPARPAGSPSATPTGTPAPTTIVGTVFRNPYLTSTGGGLYLRWDLREPQQTPAPEGLARVDPETGAILATDTSIANEMSAPASMAGFLWVTDAAADGEHLLRLNQQTLAVTGQVKVSSGNSPYPGSYGGDSHIALAGGLVWADGANRLIAVDPATMAVRQAVTFRSTNNYGGAIESDVTAGSDGGTLVVSEANSGVGTLQRRDPVTGALLASVPTDGVIAPVLSGVVSGGLWISVPTGMMGYVERLDVTTLQAAGPLSPGADSATDIEGSNGIRANLWGGALWVTNEGGGPQRNYCADPATGQRRATSPLPDLNTDEPMTVAGQREYYEVPAANGFEIRSVPVPSACA